MVVRTFLLSEGHEAAAHQILLLMMAARYVFDLATPR
jgi:hypothetical protein